MDQRKKFGLDYENRKGKKFFKIAFSSLSDMCCKRKCNVACSEESQFRILDLRKGPKRTRNRAELLTGEVSNIQLQKTYSKPLPGDPEMKKDFISLLPLIDTIYHQFYNNLKTTRDTTIR